MGQILHKRATTTQEIRKKIQSYDASVSTNTIATELNIGWNTADKWRNRDSVEDAKMGNGRANSVLTKEEEILIVETRTKTWHSLDDLYAILKPAIPKLSRSNLHRCLKYYKVSQKPPELKPKRKTGKFKKYEIGFLHIDITEFYLAGKKWYLFVAIDRVTKFVVALIFPDKTLKTSLIFLKEVYKSFSYKIHTILTDNGLQFTYRSLPKNKKPHKEHPFSRYCREKGTRHRLTKFYHPWTNGQVEKMNHILKSATVKLFHYETIEELSEHLASYLNYYNCQKKLKALQFKAPYDFILEKYKENPKLFKKNPLHYCVGRNK